MRLFTCLFPLEDNPVEGHTSSIFIAPYWELRSIVERKTKVHFDWRSSRLGIENVEPELEIQLMALQRQHLKHQNRGWKRTFASSYRSIEIHLLYSISLQYTSSTSFLGGTAGEHPKGEMSTTREWICEIASTLRVSKGREFHSSWHRSNDPFGARFKKSRWSESI